MRGRFSRLAAIMPPSMPNVLRAGSRGGLPAGVGAEALMVPSPVREASIASISAWERISANAVPHQKKVGMAGAQPARPVVNNWESMQHSPWRAERKSEPGWNVREGGGRWQSNRRDNRLIRAPAFRASVHAPSPLIIGRV